MAQLPGLLSVHELSNRHAVTPPHRALSVMGLVTSPDARYIVVCGLKSWLQGAVCVSSYCDN